MPDFSRGVFQSTLSLRRATRCQAGGGGGPGISIHALLAESDDFWFDPVFDRPDFNPRSPCGERQDRQAAARLHPNFNPRSPCGERLRLQHRVISDNNFNPRSPCGERPLARYPYPRHANFNPRSPCGERLEPIISMPAVSPISIHALLAESDCFPSLIPCAIQNFNPRSPCGERR